MKTRKLAIATAVAAAALAFGTPAVADSFQGTIWSLTNGGLQADADPIHETWRVTLSVDTNGYTGTALYLDQVAIKVSSQLFSASLFSTSGAPGDWALMGGGINNSGCSGSGSGFECANSTVSLNGGKGIAINPGNGVGVDYSWTFDLTMNNGALMTGTGEDGPSVKARFVGANGAKVGALVSEPISFTTSIPEPETYAMLLAGLGLMGFVARRRQKLLSA